MVRRIANTGKMGTFCKSAPDWGVNYKFWKDGYHPVLLDSFKKLEQRVTYIHYNPVAARFVYHERNWIHSSYCWYEDGNSEKPGVMVAPLW
ncbi:MAG: hypothetical protein ACI8Q1_003824 [Parvicella sp.]